MRVIADITDPDIIQKILDHIAAQPPLLKTIVDPEIETVS
jgi:hypothetical protein